MQNELKPLKISQDFQYCLDQLEYTNKNLFITGRAGTGKSTLLNLFRKTTEKKFVILAPTGIAALNVKGQTIHSFFGFPPRLLNHKDIKKSRNTKLFKTLETLVIDEISMVRADIMDYIDYALKLNRGNNQPFGGVQLVVIGDLFQLPPVVKREEQSFFDFNYESPFFFSSPAFLGLEDIEYIELQKVYRQEQKYFLKLLESVRLNRVLDEDIDALNAQFSPRANPTEGYITLSSRNFAVDAINKKELDQIEAPIYTFPAKIQGNFKPSLYPTESVLQLKKGAQVMFIKNDPERRFVNGTIGHISKVDNHQIHVDIPDHKEKVTTIQVQALEWEVLKYTSSIKGNIEVETLGTFTQYPLKLAWAISIHKSQGKTFDRVIIDLNKGAFAHGQTYVALSRCRTLEGIILKQKIKPRDILLDDRVVEFYESNFRY